MLSWMSEKTPTTIIGERRRDCTFNVVIPTISGPVGMMNLYKFHGYSKSVASVQGTIHRSRMSSAYTEFVDRPGSIVRRLLGETSAIRYVLRLERDMETGQCWNLPVLIALALLSQGRASFGHMGEPPLTSTDLVWADGELDTEMRVLGHTMIFEKLQMSKPLFDESLQLGRRIHLFVPRENKPDLGHDMVRWLDERQIKTTFVRHYKEIPKALQLPTFRRW